MATLKQVAEKANVPLLTAYRVLSNEPSVDESTRRIVKDVAATLNYRLNITIRDVADEAGVSIATVSYVLNNSAPVSKETRQRVLNATAALGYRPNITARNLKSNRTRMIGYAWYDAPRGQLNDVLDRFLYYMAQACEAQGYHVLTFSQATKNSLFTYEELISTSRVDGFILTGINRDDSRVRYLMDLGFPFAAFGSTDNDWDFSYVDVDGRCGTREVVEHLLERGHTRIGMLAWDVGSRAGEGRLRGYYDGLRAAGIEPKPEWIARVQNTVNDAANGTKEIMQHSDPPTAIVCVSDLLAIGAMSYLESAGLRVGEDVAVTGFDDSRMSEFLAPPLTSLRQPLEQVANLLVSLLIAEIEGISVADRQVWMTPDLLVRASSYRKFSR
jgi:DNA-binding LacI/PurR family transcriptional regulator